jgi:serine protease Do
MEVWRQGRHQELKAQLGDRTERDASLARADKPASTAAARAGIQPNDLLLAINGTPIASVEQARSLVARAGKSVALLLQRGGERVFVPVHIG